MSPSNLFMSFDRVLPPSVPNQTSNTNSSNVDAVSEADNPPKKRWNILKAVFGSSRSNEEVSSATSSDDSDTIGFGLAYGWREKLGCQLLWGAVSTKDPASTVYLQILTGVDGSATVAEQK